jgi:hypothetical protein
VTSGCVDGSFVTDSPLKSSCFVSIIEDLRFSAVLSSEVPEVSGTEANPATFSGVFTGPFWLESFTFYGYCEE